MRVIALSALVLPLGFIAQVADQHHPPSSGEYAKDPWGRRLPDAVGSGERSRPDQNEGAPLPALDVGLERGLEIGGWIPKGRLTEDGPISQRGLIERSADPSVSNCSQCAGLRRHSHRSHGPLQGGSLLTLEEARNLGPVLHVDLAAASESAATKQAYEWLQCVDRSTLNVAGPRASEDPAIYRSVVELLQSVLARLAG